MNNTSVAIVVQLIILLGTIYAASKQYKANKEKMVVEDKTRQAEERVRLVQVQREIEESIWNRVKEEREQMEAQISALRASVKNLRDDLDAERKKRASLAVKLAETQKELDLTRRELAQTTLSLREAEIAWKMAEDENGLLRQRVAQLEKKIDSGSSSGGITPENS